MNIEEAIDILKNSIADYVIGEYCEKCADNKICDDRNDDCYYQQAIDTVITAYEKGKAKNKELTERVLKLESDKFWDNVVSKSKIKEIIYPTPENEIPIEIQQSEMYKKLLKEVEE